ncbi:hypothetical protein QOT17_008354 [Balamuthia mandrillaris]
MATNKANFFESQAAEQTKVTPKAKPAKVIKPGWNHTGNTGGGVSGHEGKYKKHDGPKRVVYAEGSLPPKKTS